MTRGYKKCLNENLDGFVLVELDIPEESKIITATYELSPDFTPLFPLLVNKNPTKSRAEFAMVTKIHGGGTKAYSLYRESFKDPLFEYNTGATVKPVKEFDQADVACSSGIHFFLDKEEAIKYRTCSTERLTADGFAVITDAVVDAEDKNETN